MGLRTTPRETRCRELKCGFLGSYSSGIDMCDSGAYDRDNVHSELFGVFDLSTNLGANFRGVLIVGVVA
jgi:hypothetical protein